MADAWKKLLAATVVCHAAAFGVLLLISIFTFTTRTVLAELQWPWITARTWSEFLRLAPVSQGWATLLAFSLLVPMGETPRSRTSFERFGRSIAALLALTVVFAVGFLVGYPRAAANVERYEFTTTVARQLRESAEEARRARDYERAIDELDRYLALVGASDEAETLLMEVREQARLSRATVAAADEEPQPRVPEGATASELVDRAIAAYEEANYSTAHYMATLAQSLDPQDTEAAQLATRSLQALEALAPDATETEAATLFARKQAAKAALTRQDSVEAYYAFAALAREYPRDVDVSRYLRIAEEQVSSLAVFQDELEAAMRLPGAPDLVFVNRSTAESVELVSIGKLVRTNDGVYASQIEAIETGYDGRTIRHVTSDYGRLSGDHLIMNVIERGARVIHRRPTVHAGSPALLTDGLLELTPTPDELWTLASVSRNPAIATISALSLTIDSADRYGLLSEPIQLEFIARLVTPFTFLVLSLLLMGFGRRFRSRYLHMPPLPTLVTVPLIPILVLPVYLALQFSQRILVSSILLRVGVVPAVVLMVVLQGFLLLLALFYVALGSRE